MQSRCLDCPSEAKVLLTLGVLEEWVIIGIHILSIVRRLKELRMNIIINRVYLFLFVCQEVFESLRVVIRAD